MSTDQSPEGTDARIRAAVYQVAEASPIAPTAVDLGLDQSTLPAYTDELIRPRRGLLQGLAGLAVAGGVVAGGAFAFNAASSPDGAASPEAAVEELFSAVTSEDVVGVLEAIDPDERAALLPEIEAVTDELVRLEILTGLDLGAVSGFDFEVENLQLAARELGPDIAAVRIVAADFSSTTDPDAVPIGAGVERAADGYSDLETDLGNGTRDLDQMVETLDTEMIERRFEFIVTNDDGWHVDVGHTFLERIRIEMGWPAPDYLGGTPALGAATAEQAALDWVNANASFDIARMIQLTDPEEMAALHVYGPLIIDAVAGELADFNGVQVELPPGRVVQGRGTTVVFDSYRFGYPEPGVAMAFDGTCLRVEPPSPALDDVSDEDTTYCLGDEDLEPYIAAMLGTQAIEVRVVERDGAWFVSPVGTVGSHLTALTGARERIETTDDAFAMVTQIVDVPIAPFIGRGFLLGAAVDGELVEADGGYATEPADAPPGYRECDYVWDELYTQPDGDPGQRPSVQAEADANLEWQACLAEYGEVVEVPTLEELTAQRECEAIWDEFWEGRDDEPSEAEYEQVEDAFTACIERSIPPG